MKVRKGIVQYAIVFELYSHQTGVNNIELDYVICNTFVCEVKVDPVLSISSFSLSVCVSTPT